MPNALPDSATPDNALPDNATPDNALPDNALPDNAKPDNAIPENPQAQPEPVPVPQNNVPSPTALKPPQPTKHPPARPAPAAHHKDFWSDLHVSKEVIIGAAVGAGLFLLFSIICCIVCCCRKRKKRKKNKYPDKPYYIDPNAKGGDQNYSSSHHPLNWQSGGHPPPSGSGWQGPQPPYMMSGSDTSSNYSGPHYHHPMPPPSPGLALGFNQSTFTYDELAAATGGFSQGNLLGQGGFGYVHKGTLPNGKVVAVKSLKMGSGQGEREFQAEVEIISRVHHRHLVSLVGYCIAGGQRMLVYEFVANNTLEHHLYGKNVPPMTWSCRLRIALGSAKGLAYLHEDCHPRIIHRDIKTANILLDENFEAMVADFGLAKLSTDNHTHISTRIMGTFGYLAPEYASSGKLTEKSDVYSFGVMLLELITGKKPVDHSIPDGESLVDWARHLLTSAIEEGTFDQLADPRMGGNYDRLQMSRMATCAAASIRHSSKKRPKMSKIVHALEGDVSLEDLNEGTVPGQSTMFHKASLEQHKKLALGSVEFSEEYGTSSQF